MKNFNAIAIQSQSMTDQTRLPDGLTTDGLLSKRYGARIIDNFVILLLMVPLVVVIVGFALTVHDPLFSTVVTIALPIMVSLAYGALAESSAWQATLGKKLLGLKVYDPDGKRLTFSRALARTAIKEIPLLLVAGLPGGNFLVLAVLIAHVIVVQWSPLSQAIHDRIAGTWVAAPEESIQLRLGG